MQEYTFAKELEKLYGAAEGRFANWSAPSEGCRSTATGSLGEEVGQWLERKGKCRAGDDSLTFGRCFDFTSPYLARRRLIPSSSYRVDELLDELACTSEYSAVDGKRSPFQTRKAFRKPIFSRFASSRTSCSSYLSGSNGESYPRRSPPPSQPASSRTHHSTDPSRHFTDPLSTSIDFSLSLAHSLQSELL